MNERLKKEIIRLTAQLIAFRSTADNPSELAACAYFIAKWFAGLPVRVLRFHSRGVPSIVVLPQGVTKPRVFLNGHFDVVAGETSQFRMRRAAGRLIGRGTIDMKAQVAVMMVLMRELTLRGQRDVGLMLVGDEELGGINGTKYLLSRGQRSAFVIAGEPSDLRIASEAKGILNLELTARGRSAHTARPYQGINAIDLLAQALVRISRALPIPSKRRNASVTTCVATTIQGGMASNQVPVQARSTLNIRYAPADRPQALEKNIAKLAGRGIAVKRLSVDHAAHCDPANPYLLKLARSITTVTRRPAAVVRKAAGSDIRHFTQAGIPGVVFGPSGGGSAHSAKEWIGVSSLVTFYEVLEKFVTSL
ncbi:MAG: hypothetical protein A3H14_00825 [Candidatus Doudnabacteria bacterium RIFCSPLOWO2_12_FULL_49_8]|nr:MAG: hypothetical protein A3H14_00825 [Candidatus Doudnabacteria bacterium RIFCSPLOWO2_12_FULL_49_8]